MHPFFMSNYIPIYFKAGNIQTKNYVNHLHKSVTAYPSHDNSFVLLIINNNKTKIMKTKMKNSEKVNCECTLCLCGPNCTCGTTSSK